MLEDISFKKEAEKISLPENHNYLISYPKFVNYFAEKDELTTSDVIIGGNLVYGWMPTTFKLKEGYLYCISGATKALNSVKNDKLLSEEELITVKRVINNSIVGTSKLLHFINPDLYPIWDSKICKVMHGTDSYHTVSKTQNYFEYQEECLNLISQKQLNEPFRLVQKALYESNYNYEISKMRALEMILFYSSQN